MASLTAADPKRMQALLDALTKALGQGISLHSRFQQTAEDNLYEAYLFGLIIMAAREVGYQVTFRDSADNPATELLLRSAPGYLYNGMAATRPRRPFTHALLDPKNGQAALEVHVGVNCSGASGAGHEADVMVIASTTARNCVAGGSHPSGADVLIHLEAKCYAKNVDIGVGRQFVGMACDLTTRFSLLVAPLMDANAKQLASGAPPKPRIQGSDSVRPRHPGEKALFEELANALRAHMNGGRYP